MDGQTKDGFPLKWGAGTDDNLSEVDNRLFKQIRCIMQVHLKPKCTVCLPRAQ